MIGLTTAVATGTGLVIGIVLLAAATGGAHQAVTSTCTHPSGPGLSLGQVANALSARHKTAAVSLCSRQSPNAQADPASNQGAIATRAALTMLGVPYSWGGGGPEGPSFGIGRGARIRGFDCSGLTEYAWAQAGVRIGTTTYEQWRAGSHVAKSQISPGDLIFYETDPARPGPDHVGLAMSATHMVNAPHTGAVVRIDPIERVGYMAAVRP
ncbi:C40 family peptidase [Spongiactinospora sp. 9N601]|uniref:C40 family peptidase n=1 Tax=Spongiactinospora sp. 9N601 TaxID=3375149 RepID=UPI0037953448